MTGTRHLCGRQHIRNKYGDRSNSPYTATKERANLALVTRLRDAYRNLTRRRGEEVRIEHVKSRTEVRGNEAADKLASLGAKIEDGHRIVERNSGEPPSEPPQRDTEHKDNS